MSEHPSKSDGPDAAARVSRRRFVTGAGAAAVALSAAPATLARAYGANTKVDLGLIGCGHRGAWIADLFRQHGGYNIVAAADRAPSPISPPSTPPSKRAIAATQPSPPPYAAIS